jgi:hypothetical protein
MKGEHSVSWSGGKHYDGGGAEVELRHVLKLLSLDLLIFHKGSIRATQVRQYRSGSTYFECTVLPGSLRVFEDVSASQRR